jgi:hypothetical protein
MTRLYLTDGESRRAGEGTLLVVRPMMPQPSPHVSIHGRPLGIVWPGFHPPVTNIGIDRAPEVCPYGKPGNAVLGREAWASSKDFDGQSAGMLAESDSIWYRASIDPLTATPIQAAHGRWRPASQMPGHAVRHRLRVVKVECRQIGSVTVDETIQAGCKIYVNPEGCPPGKVRPMIAITGRFPACDFMPKGKPETWEEANYHRATYASGWMERFAKKAPWPDGWAWFVTLERT